MGSTRRDFLKNVSILGAFPFVDIATLRNIPENLPALPSLAAIYGDVIPAPENPAKWPAFRKEIHEWRESKRKELNYTGSAYQDPAFHWSNSNYTCCFIMMYDLHFFDPKEGRYTVDKILERGEKEFGGYDSAVLWHAYPRIGIDERNQFDFYRDMPGGLARIKMAVDEFHSKGVHVFINYNPWDVSTRREAKSDIDALVETIVAIGADGIFLDTMKKADNEFREKLDRIKPGIVMEGEGSADLEVLPTHHLSWAQEFGDKYVPGVLKNKWYERRHMQHQIKRWNRDHSTELQQAWMNGSGMMIWENVFGQWIAWNERDKSVLRAMLPVQRRYHELFISEDWSPLVDTQVNGVFASLWQAKGIRLWTLINRHEHEVSGNFLNVVHSDGDSYYDLVAGKEVNPERVNAAVVLKGNIDPRSIGCFISGKRTDLGDDFMNFLRAMRKIKAGYSDRTSFPEMSPVLKEVKTTGFNKAAAQGMAEIKPITINQITEFAVRECGTYSSYSAINIWQIKRPQLFERMAYIPHISIDVTPVTNSQYLEFIKATAYQPNEKHHFLKHWKDGKPVYGKENHPVVYVDLDDARAYARWAGKRLPRESEWQFAAEGYDQLKYPWGEDLKEGCYNKSDNTTPVDAFPAGKSPFGCLDMCGNTWELTESEYADTHNRFCILKGGSYFDPKGSSWYTSGGPQPSALATKFLMLYPGLDRCSTVGFRCVMDLQ